MSRFFEILGIFAFSLFLCTLMAMAFLWTAATSFGDPVVDQGALMLFILGFSILSTIWGTYLSRKPRGILATGPSND